MILKKFFKRLSMFITFLFYGIISSIISFLTLGFFPNFKHLSLIPDYIADEDIQYGIIIIILAIMTIVILWIANKVMKNKAKINAPKTLWLNRINVGLILLDLPFSIIDMAFGEDNIINNTDSILTIIGGILLLLTFVTGIINLVHALSNINYHWFKTELIFEDFAILIIFNPLLAPLVLFIL